MMKKTFLFLVLCLSSISGWAQEANPTVNPKATYTTTEGEVIEDASTGQNAPLVARFTANPSNVGEYSARYEWKIYRSGQEESPLVHRFEEDIEYTFLENGTFYVQLYATFILGTDTISYPEEGQADPIQVSINESKLTFPNAFSPNGDEFNEKLKASEYQSIISFKASIYNRWGQQLYSWDKVEGEWDGKYHGHTVKDGVYFLVVSAEGADGHKYNIRKAITVLTGLNNDNKGSGRTE